MSTIPTINNLQLLERVRLDSLNPTINAVNEILARPIVNPVFSGIFQDNELARWNVETSSFEPAGVTAVDGEIRISPSTMFFGNHSMSSSIENVMFKNHITGKVYAPLWQEVRQYSNRGSVRAYDKLEATELIFGTEEVIDPINNIDIIYNQTVIALSVELTRPSTNVKMVVTDLENNVVWESKFEDSPVGLKTFTFSTPFDIKSGYVYTIKVFSKDGPVYLRGLNGNFNFISTRFKFTDVDVANLSDIPTMSEISSAMTAEGFQKYPNPPPTYSYSYGWSSSNVVSLLDVENSLQVPTDSISDKILLYSRTSDPTSKYMFFWKDDDFPDVRGFESGIVDSWYNTTMTVNGKVGKLYVSGNPTYSQEISYKVITI